MRKRGQTAELENNCTNVHISPKLIRMCDFSLKSCSGNLGQKDIVEKHESCVKTLRE